LAAASFNASPSQHLKRIANSAAGEVAVGMEQLDDQLLLFIMLRLDFPDRRVISLITLYRGLVSTHQRTGMPTSSMRAFAGCGCRVSTAD